MSRFEVKHEDKGLAFGSDHACGEFLMIWKRHTDPKKRHMQDTFGPDPEDMLVDVDTYFNKDFNRVQMVQFITEHGFTLEELQKAEEFTHKDMATLADLMRMPV